VGAGNVAAGLVGAFPVNASPARTAAVSAARGRTQLACLLAALGVAAVVPAAGLLREVPLAALAGVLLYVATRIFHLGELRAIARFDPFELALAVITMLAVALIGVEQGVGVAVGLAILDRTRLTARPQLHVLGRIPGTTSWAPMNAPQRPAEINGVLVVLFAAPLWYANATQFRAALDHARRRSAQAPRLVVLDALGMYDVDFTGSQALSHALDALSQDNVTFAVARAGDHLKENLARAGLLQRIGADHFYASVDEAVTAA
jgi:MFS superfamily sulfate permease-like transporter